MFQLLLFYDCSTVLSGSEIMTLLGSDIVVSTVVMNQSLRFFLTVSDYKSLHRIERLFIPCWACGVPRRRQSFH